MNEEISRILKLLEDGKISAEEAERLLRTLNETGAAGVGASGERHWRCGTKKSGHDIWQSICRTIKVASRRQRRIGWWQYYWSARRYAEARRKRVAEMTVAGRVNYLFTECGLADADELSAEAGLDEKLGFDHVSRQVLRYALEDEFGIVATADEVLGLTTVAAVVAFVESRTAPDAEASGPDVGEDEPAPAAG